MAESIGYIHDDALHYSDHDLSVRGRVWGEYVFERDERTGRVFADGLMSDIARRGFDVGMLSTVPPYQIHPNGAAPVRLGHVSDLLHATTHFGRRQGLTEGRIREIGIANSTGDLAHGPFSHLSDQMKEGVGGSESFHDERANDILYLGGLYNALRPAMRPDEWPVIPSINAHTHIPAWAERPSPGLNLDRLQYGADETLAKYRDIPTPAARKFIESFHHAVRLRGIEIIDDEMVFTDAADALLFAKGYMLLSEHWNSRLKRAADRLIVLGMSSAIMQQRLPGLSEVDHDDLHYPLDYLVATDSDMLAAFQAPDAPADLRVIDDTLRRMSAEGLAQFHRDADAYIDFLLDESASEFPGLSAQAAFEVLHTREIAQPDPTHPDAVAPDGLLLRAPKYRYLDPLVKTAIGVRPLSELCPAYAKIMEQHRQTYTRHWVGRLALASAEDSQALQQAKRMSARFNFLVRMGGGPVDTPHDIRHLRESWREIWESANFYPHMTYAEVADFIHIAGRAATRRALQSGVMRVSSDTISLDFTIPRQ